MAPSKVRSTDEMIEILDRWIEEGSAVRSVLQRYYEREKTREFYKMLNERSKEIDEELEGLIPLR